MLRILLPALCGVVAAWIFFSGNRNNAPDTSARHSVSTPGKQALRRRAPTSRPIPKDPEIIRLIALAGRPDEAKAQLLAVIESGGSDQEAAKWLAPLLIASPGWLDEFIGNVPQERRGKLIAATFAEMTRLQPDSVWELVRRSSTALAVVKDDVPGDAQSGIALLRPAMESPLLSEVIFAPELGFTNQAIERLLAHGCENSLAMEGLLREWSAGGWHDKNPPCMREAWVWLSHLDPAALNGIRKSMPSDKAAVMEKFDAYLSVRSGSLDQPSMEALLTLGPAEIAAYSEDRAKDGSQLSLDTVAALPSDLQTAAIKNYMQNFYPHRPEEAAAAVDQLQNMSLPQWQKDRLLEGAIKADWQNCGNIASASSWLSRMTPGARRDALAEEIYQDYARSDPQGALSFSKTLPAGSLREIVVGTATDAKR